MENPENPEGDVPQAEEDPKVEESKPEEEPVSEQKDQEAAEDLEDGELLVFTRSFHLDEF